MKRTFTILLASIILLSACGSKGSEEAEPPTNTVDPTLSAPDEVESQDYDYYMTEDGDYVSDPTDEDGNFDPSIAGVKADGEDPYLENSWLYYWELGDEMNDSRAAYRIRCDAERYTDTLQVPGSYVDELNAWAENGWEWDYAKLNGHVTWQEKRNGQTIFLFDIGADREIQCILDKEFIFAENEHMLLWGEMTSGGYYYDGYGKEVECFNFFVYDYYITRTQNDLEINKIINSADLWNDGPVDWSTIPESCRDAWFGADSIFVSATTGEQRQITEDTYAGLKYELKKWYYYPDKNTLYLGIIPEGCEEFYTDIHSFPNGEDYIHWDYTLVEIYDAHIHVFTSDMDVHTPAMREQYRTNSDPETYQKLCDFIDYFRGVLV
ncbi:MAG: hypothetical protein HDT14_02000 [Oscillibacter sp.]|nr:hypothetical protein [Oscillibacter sp.]